ncbi:glycine cleavage system protein GcvH [Rhabdochlamydiaceae symbiont of Dictyostelium giganteum]|uniref:glycine cleavage system protein GcvH n=1 Tax=Rhabdochlamydiaceae symbiont of Dictyostelium giganteum TaxID=3342349 RepID=UPI00384BE444
MKRFTDSHEWIKMDQEEGIVGITAYAQKELGDAVYISLPTPGHQVKKGEEIVVLESTKAAADVYSPVSGVITCINTAIQDNLSLLNHSPESEGWLYRIKPLDPSELLELMSQEAYEEMVR